MKILPRFVTATICFSTFTFATAAAAAREPGLARAWGPDARVDSLVAKGTRLSAQYHWEDAYKAFEQAHRLDRRSRAALIGLGKIDIERGRWGKADNRFEDVLKLNPNDLEASHYRGICYRENGKYKALLLRKWDFNNAEKKFNAVLARDSLFLDTIYQLAVLERYRDHYENAIRIGHTAQRLRPDLSSSWVGLFRLYRYYLDNTGDGEAFRWLAAQASPCAQYALGEKYRLKREFVMADSIFRALMDESIVMNKQRVRLSRARMYYAQGVPQAAQEHFWRAVNSISSQPDADLVFEDVKYILTDEELHEYRLLREPGQLQDFFRRLWSRRDPTPAASINVRLVEHYRRLNYAEQHYAFDGFRVHFNNPDKLNYLKYPQIYSLNHEFNDKGLVYLRHGQPDDTALNVGANSLPNESWRYFKSSVSEELVFHFVIDAGAVGNNWRLTPLLTDPAMLEARLSWGTIYYRMLQATPTERMAVEQDMISVATKSVAIGFETDRHTWSKNVDPLAAAFYSAVFKGEAGNDVMELYYAIPVKELTRDREQPDNDAILEKGMVVRDLHEREIQRSDRQVKLALLSHPQIVHGLFIDGYRVQAPPDSYFVAFHARQVDVTPSRLAGYKGGIYLPDFDTGKVSVSDLVLAFEIEPTSAEGVFVKNGLKIMPNPYKSFDRLQPVMLYFEVYNLVPGENGMTAFTIDYTVELLEKKKSALAKIGGIFGGGTKSRISLSAEREGDAPTAIEQIGLDLSKAEAGEFELTVTVTDRHAKKEAKATSRLILN
ncbi:MAG: GWxTD domain-containing protein [bacterium]